MQFSITAKTILGKMLNISTPISLFYDASRFIPCNSLKLIAVADSFRDELCEVNVTVEENCFFDGIVDRQTFTLSSSGRLITLECRSKAALLIDNEMKPTFYFKLTSDELFARYIKPFGIASAEFPYPANKNFIQLKKGSSYFSLITEFCIQVYKKQPYITRANILTLEPVNDTLHIISNSQKGCLTYSKLEIKQKNDKIISKLYMKTGTDNHGDYYGAVFENDNAAKRNVRRERYYNPTSLVTHFKEAESKQLLIKSNHDSFAVEITLPYIKALDIGDRIKIIDSNISYDNLYISSMSYEVTPKGGAITKLILSEIA